MIVVPPKKPADENLDARVTVSLTRAEKVALRRAAKGSSMSAVARAAIIEKLRGNRGAS